MFTLDAGKTLAASGPTAVNFFLFGDEVTSTDAFKIQAKGSLSVAATVIYTATGVQALIKTIELFNTAGTPSTIFLYANGTTTTDRFFTATIPAGGTLTYGAAGWQLTDSTGATIVSAAPLSATGDATGTQSGSNLPLTLATVNGAPGTFGSTTAVSQVTVNAKGLATTVASVSIQIAESQVTNLVTDLAGKQPTGNYITALTGDATATGPGSVAITLATVNGAPGTFGSATQVAQVTVNGKGLATTVASVSIQIAESQVTNLVTDLAGKQPTGNYITALTGDGTATGPGSVAFTLATVNGAPGMFGSATQVSTVTVNGKGLATTVTSTSIQIAESQVTNLVTDLAGKQATGNYITALTGDATATGPGSVALTLATVNGSPGTFGSSTLIPVVTVNAKGLVTSITTASASGGVPLGGSTAVFAPKDEAGVIYVTAGNPQGWSGADVGAWVNAAFAYAVATYASGVNGAIIQLGPGSFNQSTPIDIGQLGFSIQLRGCGDGNGATILNYTPTTGIALGIGGASGNDGGVQVRDLTLTGSSAANATTAIRWGASTVGTAGATAQNVSIRRFGIGMDWRTGSVTYAVNLFNCKVQQCTTGIKPAGEANNMFGGLIANNATGMDASNSGTDFEGFGVAFDDNTTWAINAASTTFRGTLTSCRFENAGAGTSNYITMSAGSLCIIGGSFQDDVASGSATGFAQCTGGNFYLAGTWIASGGRTYANPFVMGTAMTNVQISGVLAPGSAGIAAKQLTVNGGNLSGNATGTATASFSTVATQVLPVFIPAPGEVQPNSTYKFEIHAQVINTATGTNLVAQVLVGGVAVGAAASTALGTVAHATPGQVFLITGFITFPSATTAESLVVIVPAGGSTVNAHGGTTTAAIAVAANAALQVNLSTSGATSTVVVRHSYVTKVY